MGGYIHINKTSVHIVLLNNFYEEICICFQ